jgi:hypothetical protein
MQTTEMSQRPTPRTSQARLSYSLNGRTGVLFEAMENLENDLAEAREENARLRQALERIAQARYYTIQTAESIAQKALTP